MLKKAFTQVTEYKTDPSIKEHGFKEETFSEGLKKIKPEMRSLTLAIR